MNRRIDAWLILAAALLIGFGMVMVYSASAVVALERHGDEAHYLIRQLIAVVLGLILCIATAVTPMRIIRRYRIALFTAVLLALILCFVPGIQHIAKGAGRWIGFGGFHLQPSEFAKIIVLFMLADYLDKNRGLIYDSRTLLKAALIPLPVLALILPEPDFGTTAIIAGLCFVMVFIAGMRSVHTVIAIGAGLLIGIPLMFLEEYRVQRLTSFIDPWKTSDAEGYHVIQSWVAMHSGGLWGQGLGNSMAKLHFLPEPWTDFIGAVIAEELGLIAMLILLALYALLLWRGLYIARKARDAFSTYIAATLTLMIGMEALFNLGVIMGMVPPKGLVLPFVSYGASAMISHLWVIGILLSVAAEAQDAPAQAGWPAQPAARLAGSG
jgi:cell division protein FtsW